MADKDTFFEDLFGDTEDAAWEKLIELGYVEEGECDCNEDGCSGKKYGVTDKGLQYALSLNQPNADKVQ